MRSYLVKVTIAFDGCVSVVAEGEDEAEALAVAAVERDDNLVDVLYAAKDFIHVDVHEDATQAGED